MTKQAKTAPTAPKANAPKAKLGIVLLDTKAKIEAAIGTISRNGVKLDKLIHQAACSILHHVDQHHDVTLAQRLVDAMPKAGRKNALRDWFLNYGRMQWDEEKKTFKYYGKGATLLDEAIATPFWDFKAEQEYKPFDINAALAQLLKRAENARKHGEALPEDKLAVIQAMKDGKAVHIDVPAA